MLNVERIFNLKGYEVAKDLSIPEMNSLVDSLEAALAAVYSDYKSRLFVTRLGTLTRMQAITSSFKPKADRLLDKYKNKIPAGEINRFVLLTAELQYVYAGYVTDDSDLMERAMKQGESTLKSLMIKSVPQKKIVVATSVSKDKKIDMNKKRKEILNSLEEAGTEVAKKWEALEKKEKEIKESENKPINDRIAKLQEEAELLKQIEELERKLKDLRDNK